MHEWMNEWMNERIKSEISLLVEQIKNEDLIKRFVAHSSRMNPDDGSIYFNLFAYFKKIYHGCDWFITYFVTIVVFPSLS